MQHPDLIILMHESMQREERHHTTLPHVHDTLGPISTARALAGNTLIALGTRITPAPCTRPLNGTAPDLPLAVSPRT